MEYLGESVVAALVALFGGAFGYAFREYRNRVNPLFEIIDIWTTNKTNQRVEIDSNISQHLQSSFYLDKFQDEATLGEVNDNWDKCEEIREMWPKIKTNLEDVINAQSDDDFIERISLLFNEHSFDRWLVRLLINGRLDFLLTSDVRSTPEKIRSWTDEEDDQYKIWFDLPPSGKWFGTDFLYPLLHSKCEPFIISVSRIHRKGIENAFEQFIKIFDAEYQQALACIQGLKEIDDANRRWVFECFLANTSMQPIVIENRGFLNVVDSKTKTRFSEPCFIAIYGENDALDDTNLPVVVANGQGYRFALVTERVQKNMGLGKALRELYERADGECQLSIVLRRSGVFRRQSYRSAPSQFVEMKVNVE